jgi:uncharacterized protein YutE (UPF0331/DUF86 family)
MGERLSEDDRALIKKLLWEVEEALQVLEEVSAKPEPSRSDVYAARYAISQIVEAFAAIAARVAAAQGVAVEGYAESMAFLGRAGIVRAEAAEALVKLAKLRNLIIHRYWLLNDKRILAEARSGGIEAIRRAVGDVRRFIEG